MASHANVRSSSCRIPKFSDRKFTHPSSAPSLQNRNKTSLTQLCDSLRQKVRQSFLDKSQKKLIGSFRHLEPHLVKELNKYYEDLNQKSLQESEKNLNEVFTVVSLMQDLKNEVTIEKLKDIDIDQFQKRLIDLEDKIAKLKEKFAKRSLMLRKEERELQAQVTEMANKIDEWDKPVKIDKVLPSVYQTAVLFNSGCTYNENVNCFQKFLRDRGGHTGGWVEADHLLFIRLRKKFPNKEILYTRLHEVLPDKLLEEIHEHDQWFAAYEDLKTKQKQAIAEWRINKKHSLHQTSKNLNQTSSLELPKVQQKVDINTTDYSSKKEKQKKQLEQWRNMKALELKLKDIKKKDELRKQEMEEEVRKMRYVAQKAEVERYKEKKMNEERAAILEKQALENARAEERACNANKTLKVFRQRDAEILARQKEMKDRLHQVQEDKQKILEALRKKVRVEVARDPYRLLRPTGAWKEHTKITKSIDTVLIQPSIPLNVQEVPHLGVPAWRKNQK